MVSENGLPPFGENGKVLLMTLSEWMDAQKITAEALAPQLGVHWATVYKWKGRRAFPRVAQLAEIERITEGKVTARDFMPERAA